MLVHMTIAEYSLGKTEKGGETSTDESNLSKLQHLHPLPAIILDWRRCAKTVSTFLGGIKIIHTYISQPHRFADGIQAWAQNGRIHTQFLQTGTATGRLSSVSMYET